MAEAGACDVPHVSPFASMSVLWLQHLKGSLAHLNPSEVSDLAARPLRIGLHADSDLALYQMAGYFAPSQLSAARRAALREILVRAGVGDGDGESAPYDIEIYSPAVRAPQGAFAFSFQHPERTVAEIIRHKPGFTLALARALPPFRAPVVNDIIGRIAKENALFALATALPDVIPFLSLPWAAGEFASDTAVLTANQIRMAFLLAAASDREPGYREQKGEIASLVGGAFGWRALARELAGKIPLGGGLIAKAAIAYAGTRVAGLSMDRLYRIGYKMTREEREQAYREALDRGKSVARGLLKGIKTHLPGG